MILSHKFKFIFFCNGKTGTTSIEKALERFDESEDMNNGARGLWANKHIPPAVLRSFLPSEMWDQYFKFVFVRHPQDWLVSQFKHNYKTPHLPLWSMLRRLWKTADPIRSSMNNMELSRKQVFDVEDVDSLYQSLRPFRGFPGSPSLMQSHYVYDVNGKMIVDFVGRFEGFEIEVEKVKARIGIDFELPHLNKATSRPSANCFTREAAERVRTLWDIDFRNFGYHLDLIE